ncbi:MAG TPA: phosphotransferase [Verrucomicrobiae bacterium]|nr:phosphotransferase [Verrucomicrobiae bacterium]
MDPVAVAADPRADPRAEHARAWALAQLRVEHARFAPASADASFRRYFRVTSADGANSWIVMDAPPQQEDCRPFVRITRLLRGWGLNAPEVIGEDLDRGYLLLSDLGGQTFLQGFTAANAEQLFADATAALVTMQARSLAEPQSVAFLPAYDDALLWREARLFGEWYLPKHLGVALSPDDAAALEAAIEPLIASALAQPRVFVHRDYMPRNLMVSTPSPGILDFQDAVRGPIAYDPVCLFKDAFRSWEPAFVDAGLARYWRAARAAGLPLPAELAEFRRQADWMGLQRHLKVLGIFARLTYRDGKPQYVADTPRFVRYVMDVAPRYAELAPLARIFERHVLPRVQR